MSIYDQARRYLLELARGQRVHGFNFVLIGGWAIWHYNPYLESKDVDLVIRREEYWRLKEFLRALGFTETRGGLAKKGFTIKTPEGGIDVDIYDDKIGPIEVESIFQGRLWQVTKMGGLGIRVTSPTVLLITKLIAAKERGLERRSAKGMKDLTDIFALLQVQLDAVNWEVVRKHVSSESIEAVLAAALGDYGLIKRSFPAFGFTEFKGIKKRLKEEGVI
jgi:hypothetical protein